MRWSRYNRMIHKWVSLLVGLQLLIWLGTGLYFNLIDHAQASGDELRQPIAAQRPNTSDSLQEVNELGFIGAQHVALIWIQGQPIYQVTYEALPHSYQPKRIELYDAVTGDAYSLTATSAEQLALASYSATAEVVSSTLMQPPIDELPQQQNAVWQVVLADENETHVYLDNSSGQVIAHINNDRRLRDLMFKLHFMDYANTGGFNHWLIIIFALATLFLSITGVIWLVQLYQRGQLRIRR